MCEASKHLMVCCGGNKSSERQIPYGPLLADGPLSVSLLEAITGFYPLPYLSEELAGLPPANSSVFLLKLGIR